jgi:uncharacterized RDD family membrane protein YckC
MTQPSGWYDDPQDPSNLRYWDGVIWTDHVTPKHVPSVEQSQIGLPHSVATPQQRPAAQGGYPYGGAPAPMPAWPQGYARQQATTPDGVPLSGWWKRVLARVIDGFITFILALPLTLWFYIKTSNVLSGWFDQVLTQAQNGTSTPTPIPLEVYNYVIPASLLGLLVAVVYEVLFLRFRGATPGKMAVGISVRLRERPGQLPWDAIFKRVAVFQVGALVSPIPYLGALGSMFRLVDVLWPLWDEKKQALHDKAAHTNVVVGPQPRHPA